MFVLTRVLLLHTLLAYKYSSCVLLLLRLNITILHPTLVTRLLCYTLDLCLAPRARSVLCASTLDLDFGLLTSPCPDPTWTPACLILITSDPLDFVPPLVSHPYQSLVQPTCNRQVVNLPAGLVISFLPLQHVRTPVGVTFMTG